MDLTIRSRTDDPQIQRLQKASKGIEEFFLKELMKGLEEARSEGDGLVEDSSASQMYRSFQTGAMAEQTAGSLGIAEMVFQDLLARRGRTTAPDLERSVRDAGHEPPAPPHLHPAP